MLSKLTMARGAAVRGVASRLLSPASAHAQASRLSTAADDGLADESSKPRLSSAAASSLTDIGIRRIFDEEHDMFRQSVRRFFQEECVPHELRYEEQGMVDREMWLKAGEAGILGVSIPVEYGGGGGSIKHSSITWDEKCYANLSALGNELHTDIVMPYIFHYGTEEQKMRYLPPMALGQKVGCLGMTEPGAGSDVQAIRTNAKKDGDDFIINGSKVFITNGYHADIAVVAAITNPEAKNAAHGMSLFLVDKDTPGFNVGKVLKKMGLKGQDTAELFFDDVRVHKSQILGEENKGFMYLMQQLPQERLLIAGLGIGCAEYCFETTREYVKQRKAFGKTIADLQVIQHRLAEMKTSVCVARSFMDDCIEQHYNGTLTTEMASMAKYWMADVGCKVADEGVQMHGGWGYMYEYGISRAYTSARLQPIYGGTNEIMKEIIARNIVSKK